MGPFHGRMKQRSIDSSAQSGAEWYFLLKPKPCTVIFSTQALPISSTNVIYIREVILAKNLDGNGQFHFKIVYYEILSSNHAAQRNVQQQVSYQRSWHATHFIYKVRTHQSIAVVPDGRPTPIGVRCTCCSFPIVCYQVHDTPPTNYKDIVNSG